MSDIAIKIKALMAKAESTDFPAERDAFLAKAYQLMEQHAIDAGTLSGIGHAPTDLIVKEYIDFHGVYAKSQMMLAYLTSEATGLLKAWTNGGSSGTHIRIVILGHQSDIDAWRAIYAGLVLQSTSSVKAWAKLQKAAYTWNWMDGNQRTRERASFLTAFAYGVSGKIKKARLASQQDRESTGHSSGTLVLADRVAALDPHMPSNMRTSRTRSTRASADSFLSGREAGERAQIGQGAVGGSRLALAR